MTDDEIIHDVLSGDREAFRELVVRHEGAVWGVIRALQTRKSEQDDVAQEVFLAAFTYLKAFDSGRGTFRTWLLAIARNTCRTTRKQMRAQPLPEEEPVDEETPARLAAQAEGFRQLDAALATLPEDQRLVFVLIELQGLSHSEAAEVAGVPVGTIKSRLFRAKEWLRETLAEAPASAAERPSKTTVSPTETHLA